LTHTVPTGGSVLTCLPRMLWYRTVQSVVTYCYKYGVTYCMVMYMLQWVMNCCIFWKTTYMQCNVIGVNGVQCWGTMDIHSS